MTGGASHHEAIALTKRNPKRAYREEQERDSAVEQPTCRLDLDVNWWCLPQRGVAEEQLHHAPAADTRAERKLVEQLVERVTNEQTAIFIESPEDAGIEQPEEAVGHRSSPH